MVNWHDPDLLLKDYIAFVKLYHAIAGLYFWETVLTAGFELDVLRGKRPYRWTIWLYLGTRYTLFLGFVGFLINMDGTRVPCQPFMTAVLALPFASWAFASLIIVLRVIAIWDLNVIVSSIAVAVWLGGLALHIRSLAIVDVMYNPIVESCVALHTRRGLPNAIGILVVDVVLLLTMLIGLLRHACKNPTGLWKLLYQHCIIWLVLALVAEIPPVVFFILNLNDVWNEMLVGPALIILSIGAARMYRSLSDSGCFTQCVSPVLPQFSPPSPGTSFPAPHCIGANVHAHMHLASITQSEGTRTRTTHEVPVFLPADQIYLEFIPGASISSLMQENSEDGTVSAEFQAV